MQRLLLEEDQITQYDTSYFNTQEGLDGLVTGAYEKLKFKFNYVWAIECYNMGVDEFTDANNTMPAWNHYSKDLNSAETGLKSAFMGQYVCTHQSSKYHCYQHPSIL